MKKISAPMPPLMILQQLEKAKTESRIKKIIKTAWDSDSEGFFVGLQMTLDSTIDAMKDVPYWDDSDSTPGALTMEDFYESIRNLKNQINKKQIIIDMAEKSGTDEWNKWYRRILTKELTKDLPMNTIVEVLKELTSPKKKL